MQRYIIASIVIVSAFMLPWWVPAAVSLYGALRFPFFLEALVAGVIIDVLYGTHDILGIPGFAVLCALVLIIVMTFVRSRIRYESFS